MKTEAGRPRGRRFGTTRTYALGNADREDIQELADRWRCSEAEAVRRAIRETAQREKRQEAAA